MLGFSASKALATRRLTSSSQGSPQNDQEMVVGVAAAAGADGRRADGATPVWVGGRGRQPARSSPRAPRSRIVGERKGRCFMRWSGHYTVGIGPSSLKRVLSAESCRGARACARSTGRKALRPYRTGWLYQRTGRNCTFAGLNGALVGRIM